MIEGTEGRIALDGKGWDHLAEWVVPGQPANDPGCGGDHPDFLSRVRASLAGGDVESVEGLEGLRAVELIERILRTFPLDSEALRARIEANAG